MQSERRAQWLLGLGAAIGLAAAAASLLSGTRTGLGSLSPEAVAGVNGVPILRNHYLRAVEGLASDRREPLSEADRRHVLDRLIEEELLVQHALDLGLAQRDRRARSYLVSAVLDSIVASTDGYLPSASETKAFYAENGDYFARPGRLRVQQVFVSLPFGAGEEDVARALARAEKAAERLRAGDELELVARELGDREIAGIPDAPLPPAKLREYLGPSALEAALALPPDGISDPVETPQGFHVLALVARSDRTAQPLESVRPQVIAEMKRREGDRRLRERLDELRDEADVVVASELPTLP